MVKTTYIYRLWAAAKAYPIGDENSVTAAFLTLRQMGIAISGNTEEITGVFSHQDETHVWAVCHAVITEEGKVIADSIESLGPLPEGLYYWVARRFDEAGNESVELVQTNHPGSLGQVGSNWDTAQCWDAVGISSIPFPDLPE